MSIPHLRSRWLLIALVVLTGFEEPTVWRFELKFPIRGMDDNRKDGPMGRLWLGVGRDDSSSSSKSVVVGCDDPPREAYSLIC